MEVTDQSLQLSSMFTLHFEVRELGPLFSPFWDRGGRQFRRNAPEYGVSE